MSARRFICSLLVAAVALPVAQPVPAQASSSDDNRFIVRVRSGLDGLPLINLVCAIAGCRVVRGLDNPRTAPCPARSTSSIRCCRSIWTTF